jgi:hypothetical protein
MYWLEASAAARDAQWDFESKDVFLGMRGVATTADKQPAVDQRAAQWSRILSEHVLVSEVIEGQ